MDIRKDFDGSVTPPAVGRAQIVAGLRVLGVAAGDRVVAHASLSSLGTVEGGAAAVIAAILEVIGPGGTLMMPHFYSLYDGPCDPSHPPPTYNGVVPRLLRTWPGAVFSWHPSHPVVAIGGDAALLVKDHHLVSAVGQNSPIDRMARLGGKVLLLGVTQATNTTIHVGEAYARPPYWGHLRTDRPAGRWLLLPDGRQEWIQLNEPPGDSAGFTHVEPWLVERGLISFAQIGRARCRLMPALPLVETVVDFLAADPGGLLCDRPGCTFCSWARQFLTHAVAPAANGECHEN